MMLVATHATKPLIAVVSLPSHRGPWAPLMRRGVGHWASPPPSPRH
jgi:hypothetical protein